jgi:glycine cleavage system regulatory protein
LEPGITKPKKSFTTHSLYVEGVDQAGMVYKISDFLAKNSINISKLLSRKTMSPQSGTTIYTIEMEIQVPKEKSLDELEHDFSEIVLLQPIIDPKMVQNTEFEVFIGWRFFLNCHISN